MLLLEKLRNEKELTKADVARGAEIDQASYGRIESGFRKPYEPEKKRLSNFFDTTAEDLFTEVEQIESKQ